MAFKRREAPTVEAVDLNTISPKDAETRIIQGVKKYATNEANWSKADANTPFLGSIIGMGIESSNLADVTMSIERQFLTRKTNRVPVNGGSEFRLEDGELGKLRILDGQDATAATPGLSVKMLMDLGHMPKDAGYLAGVVSYAYIVAVGDGYRMNDGLKKAMEKVGRLSGGERDEALANLRALVVKAREYVALLGDVKALAENRRKTYDNDRQTVDNLRQELSMIGEKLKGATASGDSGQVAALRSEETSVRSRLKMGEQRYKISEQVVAESASRKDVEEAKVREISALLSRTIADAQRVA
jgi:hypothetical protein